MDSQTWRLMIAEVNENVPTGYPTASLRVYDVPGSIARSMFAVVITHNQSGLAMRRTATDGGIGWTVIGSWNVEGFVNRNPWAKVESEILARRERY